LEPYAWDDDWLLAEPLDVWGVSQYLRPPVGLWAADEHVVKSDYHRISFRFNTIRCSANGKPWWLSEHTGGRTWKFLGDYLRSESELRSSLMLAFSHGAEGAIYWQWRPECFGEEAPNFGLTNQDGEPTYRTQMVKNFCEAIRRNKTLLDNLKWEKSAVGIIWEPRSYILERISLWERKMEPLGPFNIFGYYMALIDSGYQVDILNARKIITEGIPSNIKVLISPYQIIDREGLSSRIEKWVRLGGTLLAGPLYATYAEDTYASEKVPPEDMRQILGIKQKEIYYEKEPQIKLIEEEEKCEKRILKGYKLVETYESSGARAAGFYKGEVALAQNAYGRGLAFTLGSFFGNAYANGIDKNLAILIDGICLRSGVRLELRASGNVFLRVASSGNKRIVFVHNPTFETSISHITIDKYEKEATVQNMITNEEIGVIGPEKPLELKIMARDSLMLLIQ
jgi:beta-galactosidase